MDTTIESAKYSIYRVFSLGFQVIKT